MVEARQGGDPGRRGVPGRALATVLRRLPGRRAGRLPGAARVQPQPLHVPPAPARPRRHGVRRGRLQPGGAGQGDRPPRDHPPDRRLAAPRRHPRGGRRLRRGPAGRRQGALRARDAGRPVAQRPAAGLRARHRRRGGVHDDPPLQPHHAPGVHRRRRHPRPTRARTTCCAPRSPPAPSPARRSPARWPSSTSSSRAGAACTAVSWATSTSPATSTWPSPSAPRSSRTGVPTCRPAAGIVADSVPQLECEESINKAAAALRAVATAAGLRAP